MNVIPAIDIKDGRCVRLFQGDFERETEYASDPLAVAARFASLGCRTLHLVDLDGARTGQRANRDIAARIVSESGFDVQVGGGLRDSAAVRELLDVGARRCVLGSVAVTDPAAVAGWLREFGPERIVLALDVRVSAAGDPTLATHGWTEQSRHSLWACIDSYVAIGLRHVLCTDIDRDGALSGPNIDLYREFGERFPTLELQASGGVRDLADLIALREAGAASAITGRALLDGRITAKEIASFLHDA